MPLKTNKVRPGKFFYNEGDEGYYTQGETDYRIPTIGGLPALGAGIAGMNTNRRRFGTSPGRSYVTSGDMQVTKAEKRNARDAFKYYGLGGGDVFRWMVFIGRLVKTAKE